MIKLVVGLGNPGTQYKSTRHNLGYLVIDKLLLLRKKKDFSSQILLIKPTTYINTSGYFIKKLLNKNKILPEEMLVACDDFSLPMGKVRYREKGSSGGHNGLKSIISELNTELFARVRLGIGPVPAGTDPKNFVLSGFHSDELNILDKMLEEAVGLIIKELKS